MTDQYNTSPTGRRQSAAVYALEGYAATLAAGFTATHAIDAQTIRFLLEGAARVMERRPAPLLTAATRAVHDIMTEVMPEGAEEMADECVRLRRILRDLSALAAEVAIELCEMGAAGAPPGLDWLDTIETLKGLAEPERPDCYELDLSRFREEGFS